MPTKNSHIVSRLLISYKIWDKGSKCIHLDALTDSQLRRVSETVNCDSQSEIERSWDVAAISCFTWARLRTLSHFNCRLCYCVVRGTETNSTRFRHIQNLWKDLKSTWHMQLCNTKKHAKLTKSPKNKANKKKLTTNLRHYLILLHMLLPQ